MKLRDVLLRSQAVVPTVMDQAEQIATATGTSVAHVLVHYRVIDGRKLARLLSRALHAEIIDVAQVEVHAKLLEVIPRHAAERLRILPIGVKKAMQGERLYLAMSDPSDEMTVDVVEKATGRRVEVMCCDDEVLGRSFDKHYGRPQAPPPPDAPVLVGVIDQGSEFLTESTADALRYVENVRDVAQVAFLEPVLDEGPTQELVRQMRPASVALAAALAEVTSEGPKRGSLPTVPASGSVHSDTTRDAGDIPDEPLFDETTAPRPVPAPVTVPVASAPPATTTRVVVASPPSLTAQERITLHAELHELLGSEVIDVNDDAVDACRRATKATALVLLAPKPQSALLRVLLDIEELKVRPKIVVLGGDPALRMLAFVDHHAELPDLSMGARAVGVAIMVALRQVGVKL